MSHKNYGFERRDLPQMASLEARPNHQKTPNRNVSSRYGALENADFVGRVCILMPSIYQFN